MIALVATVVVLAVVAWLAVEAAIRVAVAWPLRTDFYGSIAREAVPGVQARVGVRAAAGPGWVHLGWIADPARERYRVERREGEAWRTVARTSFGSCLLREGGAFRVWCESKRGARSRLLGEAVAEPEPGAPPLRVPRVAGPWRPLFRPRRAGDYVNDHAIYRDAGGRWRLVGITGRGRGNPNRETHFAVGVSSEFPPPGAMDEDDAVAGSDELAWAPCVEVEGGVYHLFWSPHRLFHMRSRDGVRWEERRVLLDPPFHRFFRDPMVVRVAEGQWLLYATARGRFFSRVDLYQSFDLEGWQYVGGALRTGLGSERNAAVASTESPTAFRHRRRWYLSVTYTNDTSSLLTLFRMLGLRLRRESRWYHDTLVFHSDNPYDFGCYRGRRRAPTLAASLAAHAPEYVRHPDDGRWWITTAGWPRAASLTSGEVAVAELEFGDVAP